MSVKANPELLIWFLMNILKSTDLFIYLFLKFSADWKVHITVNH